MPKYLVKRSMSPDGKIDSVSVELEGEGDISEIMDVISNTDALAAHVRKNVQPGAAILAFKNTAEPSDNGGPLTVTGNIRAVYPGEVKPGNTKPGPGAILIGDDAFKVKTFDKKLIELANQFKAGGRTVTATYTRNEKWASNDLTALREAQG